MGKAWAALGCCLFAFTGCGGGDPASEPPLQERLTLTYDISQSMGERTMSRREVLRFEEAGEGRFLMHRTVRENVGDYEHDPLPVDGHFIYNEALTANIGGNDIWMDPVQLASGRLKDLGRLAIAEGSYNGQDVYVLSWDEDHKAYYAKDTGLCEGSVLELRDRQIRETVVRVH